MLGSCSTAVAYSGRLTKSAGRSPGAAAHRIQVYRSSQLAAKGSPLLAFDDPGLDAACDGCDVPIEHIECARRKLWRSIARGWPPCETNKRTMSLSMDRELSPEAQGPTSVLLPPPLLSLSTCVATTLPTASMKIALITSNPT